MPSAAASAMHRSRWPAKSVRVSWSRAIRRCWWVLVSFSQVCPASWPMLRSTDSTPPTTSRSFQRSAHSSPRRKPVTIVSQTSTAQSGSDQASLRMRAASSGDGGCGFAAGCGGGSACSIGFVDSQRQRTARFSAPLRMTWICRTVDRDRPRQTWGRHRPSHWCACCCPVFDVRPAVAVRPAPAQLGVERVEHGGPQGADLLLADQREDVPSGEVAVRGERRGLDLEQLEVPLEQLLDGGGGLRVPLLVDLDREPAQRLLRLRRGGRPGGDHLAEVVPPLGQRVGAGVDRDAQGAARQLLDLAALAAPSSRRGAGHGARLDRLAPRMYPREREKIEPAECFRW